MEKIFDGIKNPRPYLSSEVITNDQNGYPILTRFYSGLLQTGDTIFEYVQQFYASLVVLAEVFTSAFGTPVALANPNIVSGTDVVKSSDELTTYVKGTDYTMDYILGKITVLKTTASIVDEAFTTGAALDVAIPLAHTNLDSGVAPVVTSADGLTTYAAGTNYTIDYVAGTITVLSTGTMAISTSYLIDYTYITGMLDATAYHIDYDYMNVNTIGKEQKWSVQNINTSV